MSSCGAFRFSARMPTKYSFISADARIAPSMSARNPSMSMASRWNQSTSESGSPSSAAMTLTGMGMKTASTRSTRPASLNFAIVLSTSGPTSSPSQRFIDERAKANSWSLR